MKTNKYLFTMTAISFLITSEWSLAQARNQNQNDLLTTSITDVTAEYAVAKPTPVPVIPPANGGIIPGGSDLPQPGLGVPGLGQPTLGTACDPLFDPLCNNPGGFLPGGGGAIGTILNIGEKIWNYIVTNKPNAQYKTLKAAVLAGGATNWSQMKGWAKPVSKVFRVQFKNLLGKSAGGFDYRITFIYGGNFQGKGKYIGQIAFTPVNIFLKTDRQLNINVELLDALNFGTEENPIAGAQLLITWNSPTTLRYTMNSIEYFFYGTGEMQDISNGTAQLH